MREKALAVLGALVAIVLALTNPGRDDFVRWFEGKAEAAVADERGLAGALSGLSLLERTLEVRGRFVALGDARQAVPGSP